MRRALLALAAAWCLTSDTAAQITGGVPSFFGVTPTGVTGTGNIVLSAGPTFSGSTTIANILTTGGVNVTNGSIPVTGPFRPATNTLCFSTATTKVFCLDPTGRPSSYGTAPSVVAGGGCGGSPSIDANATDVSGRVTVGTTTTTCVITFATAFGTYNHCQVTSGSTLAAFAYTYTLSAITVSATVLGGDIVDYRCDGI